MYFEAPPVKEAPQVKDGPGAKEESQPFSFHEIYAPEPTLKRMPASEPKPEPTSRLAPRAVEEIRSSNPFGNKGVIEPAGVMKMFTDSYFMSSLNSLAGSTSGANLIRNMIKTNGDGTYTVTFPGDKAHPITLTARDYDIENTIPRGGRLPDWDELLEYAFQKRQFGVVSQENYAYQGEHDRLDGPINSPDEALELLTGKKANRLDLTDDKLGATELESKIITALDSGAAITAKTGPAFLAFWGRNQPLPENYTYSVQGYDEGIDMLVVHNPSNGNPYLGNPGRVWDGMTVRDHGDLTMTIQTFKDNFDILDIAPTK